MSISDADKPLSDLIDRARAESLASQDWVEQVAKALDPNSTREDLVSFCKDLEKKAPTIDPEKLLGALEAHLAVKRNAHAFLRSLSLPIEDAKKPLSDLIEHSLSAFGPQYWAKKVVETLASIGKRQDLAKVCKYLALTGVSKLEANDPKKLLFSALENHLRT